MTGTSFFLLPTAYFLLFFPAGKHSDGEAYDDDGEACRSRDFVPCGDEHFNTHECEDEHDGVFELVEFAEHGGECKVQRTQSENRHDVARKDDERVECHAENGGDGIHREKNVRCFDDDEGEHERSHEPFAVLLDEKRMTVDFCRDGEEFLGENHNFVLAQVLLVVVIEEQHFERAVQE